jgi:hypothetical protein
MSDQPKENSLAEASNAVVAMHRKFNIPGDVVFKATAALPDHHRNAIRGMHAYATEHDLSLVEQSELLSKGSVTIADSTISLVYRGKYEAKLDNVVKIYAEFLKLQQERSTSRRLPFIETDLSRDMFKVCERTREFQKISYIFSDGQIGKSENLKEHQRRNNHGQTTYIEMPTGGALIHFCTKLGEKFKFGVTRYTDLRRRILDSFDDRMLLIVDEAHRCMPDAAHSKKVSRSARDTLDFIKEIFNECECGVVICATNIFREEMENGEHAGLFKQLLRRQLCILQLPNKPSKGDLATFAAAHGLTAAKGAALALQNKIIEEDALGYWLTVMRVGRKIAGERKQKFDWPHVIDADAGLKAMKMPKE